jgi:hypothetical protein
MALSTYDAIMRSGIFGIGGRSRPVIVETESLTDVEVSRDSVNLWLLSAGL